MNTRFRFPDEVLKLFVDPRQPKDDASEADDCLNGLMTHLLEMSSDKIVLKHSVRLLVRR